MYRIRSVCLTAAMVLPCLLAGPAQAGDYYFGCATPGDGFFLEEGDGGLELYDGETRRDHRLVREYSLRERDGLCTAPDGQAFAWSSRSFVYELTTDIDGTPVELTFLCEAVSSGVPASVQQCTETTTSDKQLEPAYIDLAQ